MSAGIFAEEKAQSQTEANSLERASKDGAGNEGTASEEKNQGQTEANGRSSSDQASSAKKREPPKTMFNPMLTILGVYLPNSDMISVKIPYFMPMLQGRFSHRFTDYNQIPELSFIADGEVAPLWFRAGTHISFKPLSFLTFSAGGDIGTSWGFDLGFLSMDFIGKYDSEKKDYETFTPFTHWVYDFWAQIGLNYDIGALLTSGKQHIVFTGTYRAKYAAMTGVENGEVWMHQGSKEQANGPVWLANASLNYALRHKYIKSIGFSASASSYFSDSFYDEKYRISDPTFVDLSFALTSSASIGPKNRFMLMIPVSGKRDFDCDAELKALTAPEGRKWAFDGVILTFTHIF